MLREPQPAVSPYVTRQDLRRTEEQIKRKWKILLTLLALALRVTPPEPAAATGTGTGSAGETAALVEVLVIDTDPVSSSKLTAALGTAGFDVIAAASPVEGFRRIKDVGLVILDETLPGIADICSQIRAQSDVPIILLGSEPDAKAWNQAVLLGADAYLRRAVSRQELVARIRAILRRYPGANISGGI